MYLRVEDAIDEIKSSLLTSTRQQFHRPKSLSTKAQKVWAGMQDGLKIFKLYRRFLLIEFSFSLTLMAYFLLLFAYYELEVAGGGWGQEWVTWGLLATSAGLLFGASVRFFARKEIAIARRQMQTTTLSFMIELLVILLQPYPHLDDAQISRTSLKNQPLPSLKLNHILLLLSLLKLVFLLRGLLQYLTPYSTPRNFRVGKMYGVLNSPFYNMRCLFRQHPVILISSLYLFCMAIFAYCYRVFENGVDGKGDIGLGNTIWLALMTMTTVGFGDVSPVTRLGGIVTVVSSYAGVIGTSLFVLSITTNLELSYGQERALMIVKRLKNKREQKIKSALFIRTCLWRLWLQHKQKTPIPISTLERQLKRQLSNLSAQQKNSLKQNSLFQEVMQQQFEIIKLNINSILENCTAILEECTNKQQLIEGVLRNLEEEKEGLKAKVIGGFMSDVGKSIREITAMQGRVEQRVTCFV